VPALNQRRGRGNTDTPASPALYPVSCILYRPGGYFTRP